MTRYEYLDDAYYRIARFHDRSSLDLKPLFLMESIYLGDELAKEYAKENGHVNSDYSAGYAYASGYYD